ncbi:MAG: ADP-glyceromanno-heptose 6-epimerase [Bdellovibrionales bacterium]|nr:ADP-glyceromanno-heptose 6-epimerase [Bdellovibrionales bacterium]
MVIVTGGNGFIGSAMVWELNEAGIHDIIVCDAVDLSERKETLKKRQFHSFLHRDELFNYLKNTHDSIDCIFHMGASSSTTVTDEEFLRVNNTEYTRHLFDWCLNKNVTYIYASSASVYGDGNQGFDDKVPTSTYTPLHAYGRSKANFDMWVEKQPPTPNKWYGLRFFNVYGPNEYHKGSMLSVPYKAQKQIEETGKVKLFKSYHPDYKDGEQMRDFIYVKDITRWMLELYQLKSAPSGVYNMGFGKARTWKDLTRAAFTANNKELNIEWIEMPDNLKNQYQYITEADMSQWLTAHLSQPQWPLEKGIEDYLKNYLIAGDTYL